MGTVTIGFSIPEEDKARLEHLVEYFAPGNRSAFLRLAIKRMESLERAERFRALQAYGTARRAELGLDRVPIETIVERVLASRDATQQTSWSC
jgi:Arc/MetJ-type ribon-helix-helix transcriptional regulator